MVVVWMMANRKTCFAMLLVLAAWMLPVTGCRHSGTNEPDIVKVAAPVPTPQATVPQDERTNMPPKVPGFSEAIYAVIPSMERALPSEGKRSPTVCIEPEYFTSDNQRWLAKNLRIQLNRLCNGRVLFVDGLSDQHAGAWNRAKWHLSGQMQTDGLVQVLSLDLRDSKTEKIVWSETVRFR
jgi:hypothetical protein